METMHQICQNNTENLWQASLQPTHSQPPKSSKLSNLSIQKLWVAMTQIYGQLFVKKFGASDNGFWSEVLADLDEANIMHGLRKIKNLETDGKFDEFPPNALQFKKLCLGLDKDYGLPTPGRAFNEMVQNIDASNPHWSHHAVVYSAYLIGRDDIKKLDTVSLYRVFKEVYAKVCAEVRAGKEIPRIHAQKKALQTNHNQASMQLKQLKAAIGR